MTHELKHIIRSYREESLKGGRTVLATVVSLEGSSYRRPGVRMLIHENGGVTGAVSGGCVEKAIIQKAAEVFQSGKPQLISYDGRYRLGCEGILYILLEPFAPGKEFLEHFDRNILERKTFEITTIFELEEKVQPKSGSFLNAGSENLGFRPGMDPSFKAEKFIQRLQPCFRIWIFGAEHDAVQVSRYAALSGWEVTVVVPPDESKDPSDFSGADSFFDCLSEELPTNMIDTETAVLIMSHNFARDLKYLSLLRETRPVYLGILGPSRRREKLMDQLLERHPEISESFLDRVYAPAGLNLGAESAQEITISILAEILSVVREQKPISLREKSGTIHSK